MPRRVIIAIAFFSLGCSKSPPPAEQTTTSASASASAISSAPSVPTTGVTVLSGDCAITVPKTAGVTNAETMFGSLQPRFRAAYNRGLQKDEREAGTYTFKASIGADGKVTKVEATNGGLSKDVVGAMDQIVKTAQFDVGGKPATVSGSIDCRPPK